MQQADRSPEALFRYEARARATLISGVRYVIALDLTGGDETFESDTTITFACSEHGASTFLDLAAPSASFIELNGQRLEPSEVFDGHRITLAGLQAANTLRVVATCKYSNSGTGLHFFRDPVDGNPYLHSHFEAREAHKVFASFDQPDLKATFSFSVNAPAGWLIVSNTTALEQPPDGESGRWVFPTTELMSTYVTAIVAGPYHVVRDTHGDIELGIYVRRSLARYLDADEIFEVTKAGFDFFNEYFGLPYPFGKYDQLFVPEFNAGAMENAGCVTFSENYVFRSKVTETQRENRAGTILHEMAHMWFGDLVTMRWWDDLWLNESFATYMGTLAQSKATRWTNAWTTFARSQKLWAVTQDQMPTTHPIVADAPDTETARTNFDGISYAKGASVLKQLAAYVGEQPFAEGVRNYIMRNRWSNAELADFLGALEQTSGRDLGSWSKEWLETAGVNTMTASLETSEGRYTAVSLEQTAGERHPTVRSHRIAIGLYDFDGEALVLRRRVELDAVGASTQIEELVGEPVAALVLPNDLDLAYTKIRLDDASLATITDHLARLQDPLARVLCWNAAVDQVREAELPARDFVRLVANNIHVETDPGAVNQLLSIAMVAAVRYGDPANRTHALQQIAQHALTQLIRAESGSDLQLVWARAFMTAARSDEHLGIIKGLLDGDVPFTGLRVDTDLRWLAVQALAAMGAINDALIDAELEIDPTDAGQRHAAAAHSLRPQVEAKAEAWRRIVEDGSTPLATIRALLAGFQRPDQADLIMPYRDRYFDTLETVWESRPPEVVMTFVAGMYPDALVSEELVTATEDYLDAHPKAPPPVARYLAEHLDEAKRTLRIRQRDIEAGRSG
jgi:aminopeptidase N